MSETLNAILIEEEPAPSRRVRRRKWFKKKSDEQDPGLHVIRDTEEKPVTSWSSGRHWSWWVKSGFLYMREPGIQSTTHQCEATYLAVAAPPTSSRGFIFGVDAFSDWPFFADPFMSYEDGELTVPNVVRIGDVGKGKSSGIATMAMLRPLMLGRRCVMIDKKYDVERGEGEHAHKAGVLGVNPIKFTTDGTGSRINLLDPAISARFEDHHEDEDTDPSQADELHDGSEDLDGGEQSGQAKKVMEKPTGQSGLLRAVITEALERPMTSREGKAVRMAHETALKLAAAEGRVATIRDIFNVMMLPDEDICREAHVTVAEVREWGLDPAFALERLLDDDLAGIVDGPTSEEVSLGNGLTVFDVSTLPEDGAALGIVMLIISTWLANTLYAQKKRYGFVTRTHLVIEEAWHVVRGAFALIIQRLAKTGRAFSLSCDFAFHHVSDIPAGSPAAAILKEAGTKYFYGQDQYDEAMDTVTMFALPPGTEESLMGLDQGVCLVKVGSKDPNMVVHLRSDWEIDLTNSDLAMLAQGSLATAA